MNKVKICYQTEAAPRITEKRVSEIVSFSKNHKILSIELVPETMEEKTERNMQVVSNFMEHYKSETGKEISEFIFLTFFNA